MSALRQEAIDAALAADRAADALFIDYPEYVDRLVDSVLRVIDQRSGGNITKLDDAGRNIAACLSTRQDAILRVTAANGNDFYSARIFAEDKLR
jgi:hypothetical protein